MSTSGINEHPLRRHPLFSGAKEMNESEEGGKMKIVKIGKFNEHGWPTGWHLNSEGMKDSAYCLGIIDEKVFVNGVEIVEWTEKRLEMIKEARNE